MMVGLAVQTSIVVLLTYLTVTSTEVFHRCRGDEDYSINCPLRHQIINITSAVVGFSSESNDTLSRCPRDGATCTRTTNHPVVRSCNGQSKCSFSQSVLNYSPSDRLCDRHQNGNFITITYDCLSLYQFRGCSKTDDDAVFTLDKCQLGEVIHIERTLIAFSQHGCFSRSDCSRQINHDEVVACNGKTSCSLSQNVFNFPPGTCQQSTKANSIVISYYCINGTRTTKPATTEVHSTDGDTVTGDVTTRSSSTATTNELVRNMTLSALAAKRPTAALSTGSIVAIAVMGSLLLVATVIVIILIVICVRKLRASKRKLENRPPSETLESNGFAGGLRTPDAVTSPNGTVEHLPMWNLDPATVYNKPRPIPAPRITRK